jgi:hypothetical protein
MSQQPYQSGKKRPEWSDPFGNPFTPTLGIYKGLVKKIDTGTRSGRLYVYVEGLSTTSSNDEAGWILVDYASPFMGRTMGPAAQGAATNVQNDFANTQQSYGFFMTPPDIGNYVLCCFPDDNKQTGYWFACVNPALGKQMIPSIGGLPLNRIDPISVPPSFQSVLRQGGIYPVGEFNENDTTAFNSNWASRNLKPLHIPQFTRYFIQGLDTDTNGRGVISSSVQRDPINSVAGFSTPGRPTNDPANDPNLNQKLSSGNFDPQEFVVRNRVGGHSLTMDDGDLRGNNNLVKLRTAAGHQILMNDTPGEEFMYIANSNGTAWIELTKEGDVLVYGQRDLSIRTRGNLMMHSDSLIQMNARGPIQMKSAALQVENQATIINSEQAFQAYTNSASLVGKSGVNLVGQKVGISGLGGVSIDGALVSLNSGGLGGAAQSLARGPSKLNQYSMPDTTFVPGQGWTAVDGVLRSINYRVPTHEPYVRGNVAALIEQQQEIFSNSIAASAQRTVDGNLENPVKLVNLSPGIDAAAAVGLPNDKAAPNSSFVRQPVQPQDLGALDNVQVTAYFAQMGFTQSNSNYAAQNQDGYLGKYQLSPASLINLGYLKPTAPRTLEGVTNPNNWTGLNGVLSADQFQVNGAIQELTMYEYTKQNYASLQNIGLIDNNSTPDEIAGLLSASHFAGPEQTAVWARENASPIPGYTTAISNYYNQGRYSQSQVPVIQASIASKQITSTVPSTQFTGNTST